MVRVSAEEDDAIVILKPAETLLPAASCTCTPKVDVPCEAGIPETTPVVVDN